MGCAGYCQQNAKDWNERCKSHQEGVFGAYATELSQLHRERNVQIWHANVVQEERI